MKKLILVLLLIFSTFNAYAYERPADSEIKKITMVGEILAIEKKDGSVLITNLLTPKLDDEKQNETSSTPNANNDSRISDNLDLEGISKPANGQTLVTLTEQGKKYHYSWCHTVKNPIGEVTVTEALRLGYEACKVCSPPSS
ncbi:MAG: hypothetical protein IJP96_11595, partial [Synergistaceae bacterium]|nr:hypothetical protein [Synergistaceae bacterium]